jgi:hypothetical protein
VSAIGPVLGDSLFSDFSADDLIRAFTPPATITYMSHEGLAKMKTRLGAWAKPNEPFRDGSGKWYVRDKKGTIRRCDNTNSSNPRGAD